jgi:hypothetical protein
MRAGRVVVAWAYSGVLLAFTLPGTAAAQPPSEQPSSASARAGGAELGVGYGLLVGSGPGSITSTTRARTPAIGGSIELDAGWRALPALTVGVWGFGAQFSEAVAHPSPADGYAAGAGVQGTVHFRPDATDADPWLMVGAGWRAEWLRFVSDGVTTEQGIDLVRAHAGVDLRVSPTLALGPMVGGSLSTSLSEETESGRWHPTPVAKLNAFVLAGIRATLDVPLQRARPTRTAREVVLPP